MGEAHRRPNPVAHPVSGPTVLRVDRQFGDPDPGAEQVVDRVSRRPAASPSGRPVDLRIGSQMRKRLQQLVPARPHRVGRRAHRANSGSRAGEQIRRACIFLAWTTDSQVRDDLNSTPFAG